MSVISLKQLAERILELPEEKQNNPAMFRVILGEQDVFVETQLFVAREDITDKYGDVIKKDQAYLS